MFIEHLKKTIANLRQMPEKQRRQLFFAIMAVAAVTVGYFGITSTIQSLGTISKSIPSVSLQLPANPNVPTYDTVVPPAAGQSTTASWSMYVNDNYGFQLQYPQNWFVKDSDPSDVFISSESPQDPTSFSAEALQIITEPIDPATTLDQLLEKKFGKEGTDFTREKVLIGGEYAAKIKTTCQAVGCGSPEWIVIKNGYSFDFTSGLDYRPIFDQIISTLVFTQSAAQPISN